MKTKGIPELKKELLILQSRWVKLTYSNEFGFANCFTCDFPMDITIEFCQCGHCFSKSGYPALQFEVDNLRPQCKIGNEGSNGNEKEFKKRLIKDIGISRFTILENHKNDTVKLDRSWLVEQINEYKQKIKDLNGSY